MKEKKNIYDENVCLKDGKQYSELVTRGRTAAHKRKKSGRNLLKRTKRQTFFSFSLCHIEGFCVTQQTQIRNMK
jgi:hypothetical protein